MYRIPSLELQLKIPWDEVGELLKIKTQREVAERYDVPASTLSYVVNFYRSIYGEELYPPKKQKLSLTDRWPYAQAVVDYRKMSPKEIAHKYGVSVQRVYEVISQYRDETPEHERDKCFPKYRTEPLYTDFDDTYAQIQRETGLTKSQIYYRRKKQNMLNTDTLDDKIHPKELRYMIDQIGLSISDLCQEYGVTYERMRQYLLEHAYELPKTNQRKRKPYERLSDEQKDEITSLWNQGYTSSRIAREMHLNPLQVRNIVNRHPKAHHHRR